MPGKAASYEQVHDHMGRNTYACAWRSTFKATTCAPAAEFKIDRAFVTDLASSKQARGIAQAIMQMAHTLV